ncbi:MAG: chemotaxis response regulator protein-glutamate methylesterase [Pseudohongiellaceae bacterium]|nr:chemotaxis response regulator protein-glutamate methylesterase [Pseudohongiellaceae bacterium]
MSREKIKVLVVDDSALIRSLLTQLLNEAPDIEVVGVASDPFIAREKIKSLNPDVLTLDIEMPRMDGLTFLRNLMRLRPMPVVMVSSLTEKGAKVTMHALELGAVDFITKPKVDISHELAGYADELIEKVRTAAGVKASALHRLPIPGAAGSVDDVIPKVAIDNIRATDKIIAIGASTGGTEAIKEVLLGFPPDAPGIVVTQHIPAGFSAAFAERMNKQTRLVVKEAEDGDHIVPGHVYIAPGDRHLLVMRSGARYECKLSDAPKVNRHRPSVDVLFRSVLQAAGLNSAAALLTGMGGDGADSMVEMKNAGVHTVAQDEATSVVWGMPGEAVKRGGVSEQLPLSSVASALIKALCAK